MEEGLMRQLLQEGIQEFSVIHIQPVSGWLTLSLLLSPTHTWSSLSFHFQTPFPFLPSRPGPFSSGYICLFFSGFSFFSVVLSRLSRAADGLHLPENLVFLRALLTELFGFSLLIYIGTLTVGPLRALLAYISPQGDERWTILLRRLV